ncbi:HesA/MoeB/ThiF family protein [Nocardiopsis baichengensis]|uniref:HesA/MoeB/ThiF family protein n=1 Tax=Nocardiopsis baichengensis TaxID=280240 RepID=UPI0003716151|nr:HesA/MoeB/ThiF family protein [Nocardiopsis baichengensis]
MAMAAASGADSGSAFIDTRYNRQELMPQVGAEGQRRIAEARVAVIGAGGVKAPLLYYLAAAGIGHLRIIDFDDVELSNLNRQILFTTDDIGRNKAKCAKRRLEALNDEIEIEAVPEKVDRRTIGRLLADSHVIVEGGDSLAGRLLVNTHCLAEGVPMVHASAQYNYGYVLTVLPGRSSCFSCVFPDLPQGHGGSVPVIGVATGIAGSLGAAEVIKLVLRTGEPITDGVLSFTGFQGGFRFVPAPRRPDCMGCAADAEASAAG